jgi:hypothetical protein
VMRRWRGGVGPLLGQHPIRLLETWWPSIPAGPRRSAGPMVPGFGFSGWPGRPGC